MSFVKRCEENLDLHFLQQKYLTLLASWVPESCIKIKINLNFYFRTSL